MIRGWDPVAVGNRAGAGSPEFRGGTPGRAGSERLLLVHGHSACGADEVGSVLAAVSYTHLMYAALVTAMVAGRLVWGAVRFVLAGLTGSSFPFSAFLPGTAAYPSTVLMDVIPAKVAGVAAIVMTTPAGKEMCIRDRWVPAPRPVCWSCWVKMC